MTKVVFPVALVLLVLLVGGCPNAGPGQGTNPVTDPGTTTDTSSSRENTGSLTITLPLLPARDVKKRDLTVPASYDVSGTGPGGASFLRSGITDSSVTIASLVPGEWDVTVRANDLDGLELMSTDLKVTVIAGETAAKDVKIGPLSGDGAIDVFVTWPAIRGISLSNVTLTATSGAPLVITFPSADTANGNTSVSAVAAVPPGQYTLSRVFSDGTGGVNALQITSGATTTFVLSVISGVDVAITPDTSKVIPITFEGDRANLGKGASMTITAVPAVSKQFSSFTYQWYLNGVTLAGQTTGTVTIKGPDHPAGTYRLDVVVASQGVLSSDSVLFTIAGQ